MFDYNLIDAIDPRYLEQFLDPKQTGAAAFKCPGDCEKSIEHDGKAYTVKFTVSSGLEAIWKDYAYDLVGSWKGVDENSRMLGFGKPGKSVLKKLQERTYCFDWNDAGFIAENDNKWQFTSGGAFELSHEQVKQRVLCFIAVCVQALTDENLGKIIDMLPHSANGRLMKGRFIVIAHLPVAADSANHYVLRISAFEPDKLWVMVTHKTDLKKEPEGMNELFDLPLNEEKQAQQAAKAAKRAAEQRLHISYKSIDKALSPEACLCAMTAEVKGKRKLVYEANKELTVTVGPKQIHVKCTVATSLSRLWKAYTENIEPDWEDEEEACYYDLEAAVEAAGEGIDPRSGEFAKGLENGVPEGVPALSQKQVRRRCLWFLHACCVCTTDAALQRIAELAPKKKDGGLYKKRILRIATLTYTEDGQAFQIIAQNMSDTELAVKMRKVVPDKAEMNEMSKDVAMTTDLFDFTR